MNLFYPKDAGQPPSREDWLRRVFSREIQFPHISKEFYFEPATDLKEPEIISGRVGRSVTAPESAPPTQGLTPIEREGWQSALVLIDPRPHEQDGQKVAFERKGLVGGPAPIFTSLAAKLNEDDDNPYLIEVAPISDEKDFWNFVSTHEGDIVSVTFELFAPNGLFSSSEEFNREMRELKQNEKARKVKVTLENPGGLNLDTPGVHAAAENAAKGGGSIRARTRENLLFNSKDRVRGERIDEEPDQSLAQFVRAIASSLFK